MIALGISNVYGVGGLGERENMFLGKPPLERVVISLSRFRRNQGRGIPKDIPKHLLFICQMFPELMRFRCMREAISESKKFYDEGKVQYKPYHIYLQNNWAKICRYYFDNLLKEKENPDFGMEKVLLELSTVSANSDFLKFTVSKGKDMQGMIEYIGEDMDKMIEVSVTFAAKLAAKYHESSIIQSHTLSPLADNLKVPVFSLYLLIVLDIHKFFTLILRCHCRKIFKSGLLMKRNEISL